MHIVIAAGGMPFGPFTPEKASLGGSETAALMLSKALAARGNEVHLFCILPSPPAPDAWVSGLAADDKVIYHHISEFGDYAAKVEHDLTIGLRDPQFAAMFCNSKKKVLWCHDIFTKRGMGRALDQMSWCFDEIWCVSEWHRQQIHTTTGYPLSHIKAIRNGIVKYDDVGTLYRDKKSLIYAARPERGLDNLIMPGGVMENLPDYTLTVAMYEHFPEHMRDYYMGIMARMKAMPNVNFVGGKPNHELRRMIADSTAYIYPTQFEETSCILARECIEQGTPFLTTKEGALPETLQGAGIYFEDWFADQACPREGGVHMLPEKGTPEWCALFAEFVRFTLAPSAKLLAAQHQASGRTDLYWDGVAEDVEKLAIPDYHVVQSVGAAIIAYNNEDTMLRCLNSLVGTVDQIQIAHGPSTDNTQGVILRFAEEHQEIAVKIKDVPKIEAYKFGFDDARNASVEGLNTDWIFWIDTDEYLVGNFRKYIRNNSLQSYMISQHHFTVEPKGAPTQIDRPARLFRTNQGIKFKGHIHEHAEVAEGGPGRAYLIPDVDIGHTGYQNEEVRKSRFERNWPFLKWEHELGNDRKLNHFLWLRDIVHRMRFAIQQKDIKQAVSLAQEAETYYNEHYEDMAVYGPGMMQSLHYLAEAYTVLNKGVPVRVTLQMDDRSVALEGKFTGYGQIERVVRQMLEPEFKERASRYW